MSRRTAIQYLSLMPLALVLSGCISYKYTRTTAHEAPAKEAGCFFEVLTTRPDRAYDELGVLDCNGAEAAPRDMATFREKIAPMVCGAGGDAVLADVNGAGNYVRGTVILYRE
jgi:hypothetical protein